MGSVPAIQQQTSIDAQALIAQAITAGTDPAALERLVGLGERMLAIQARQAWNEAMIAAQSEFPSIKKTEAANIRTRAGGQYKYHYASLEEIAAAVKPVLHKHDLVISWQHNVEAARVGANCRILHRMGHTEESGMVWMPVEAAGEGGSGAGPAQRVGIASTYACRYSLRAVLGLTPEDDDDAGSQHDTERPAPAMNGPDAASEPGPPIFVTEIAERTGITQKTGKTWKMKVVRFSDGREAGTFDFALAQAADSLRVAQVAVVPVFQQSGKFLNLTGLEEAESAERPDDSVPF